MLNYQYAQNVYLLPFICEAAQIYGYVAMYTQIHA